MGKSQEMEPCPFQNPLLRPRYPVLNENGYVDKDAFPNRCMRCVSDEGNWNCQLYRNYITDLIKSLREEFEENKKEAVIASIPNEYRDVILKVVA